MMKEQFDDNFFRNLKYIHEIKIFNEIQNNKKILIFDFRKREEFVASHIELSVNIPHNEYDHDFFESLCDNKIKTLCEDFTECEEVRKRIKNYKRNFVALIMSQEKIKRRTIESCESMEIEQDERDRITKTLLFYKALVCNHVREIGVYNSGMGRFSEHFQFLLWENMKTPLVKDISAFPTDVLDHRVYVGNQRDATSEEVIKYLKITHIVNVTQHVFNKFEDKGVKYLNIEIDDTDLFKISKHFKTAYDFIEEALTVNTSTSTGNSISTTTSTENLCKDKLVAEKVDTELTQFIDEVKDMEICMDCNSQTTYLDTLEQFGVTSLDNWKEAFYSTDDLNKRNKIIQLVFKNYFSKTKSNARILIHCSLGMSRSPTIAIMYLMKKFRLPFDDAYSLILMHREKSAPIDSFLDELRDFEKADFEFPPEEAESSSLNSPNEDN